MPSAMRLKVLWIRVGLGLVMVEAPFPGCLLMQRFPPPSIGRTLEGGSCPWMSSFRDGVIGIGQSQQVQQYQGGECILAHQYDISDSMSSTWLGGTGGSPIVGGKRVNLK